jgi:Tol biopolymer transport system component
MRGTVFVGIMLFIGSASIGRSAQPEGATPELLQELKEYPHKIVYESHRDGTWEIYLANADGSHPVNLTRTPDVDELYPKVSPDGTRICFCADEGQGARLNRNLYLMNIDGSARRKVADGAREPCWSPDGKSIAFVKNEFRRFDIQDFVTKGLFIYDLNTGLVREHTNPKIHHVWCLNWSPDGNWFIATVHGGMGYGHAIIALEAAGDRTFDLHCGGCRPDLSPDGRKIVWGHGDCAIGMADLDLSAPTPKTSGHHNVVESKDPFYTYQVDWSPDGRYLAFTYGPKLVGKPRRGIADGWAPAITGVEAPGWNICVADPKRKNRWAAITLDGASNKEPDWVPVRVTAQP